MSMVVKILKDTTINEVDYKTGEEIDLVATGQVSNYFRDLEFIAPRCKKKITLEVPSNFPVLSTLICPDSNMLEFDFTLLDSVKSKSPHYIRGRKTRSEYYVNDILAASKDFSDVLDENGVLKELWVRFSWYDFEGNVVLHKDQMVKEYNKFESETTMRQRRERQLDFLIGAAKGTAQEQYLTILLTHYRDHKNNYTIENDLGWSVAIDEDLVRDLSGMSSDEQQYYGTIKAILLGDTPRIDDPSRTMKIWQALKYQIGTFDLGLLDEEE